MSCCKNGKTVSKKTTVEMFLVGIGDLFKAKENSQLKARIEELESMLTTKMKDSLRLREMSRCVVVKRLPIKNSR